MSESEEGQDRLPLIPKRWHGPYRREGCAQPPHPLLLEGVRQFNAGEFFEQHETLEDLWRREPEDVRYLYQGILQVGVGFLHLGRGNHRGAVSKLQAGIDRLRWFEPSCQGVDVARLVEESRLCLQRLRELGPERLGEFDRGMIPKVHLIGDRG